MRWRNQSPPLSPLPVPHFSSQKITGKKQKRQQQQQKRINQSEKKKEKCNRTQKNKNLEAAPTKQGWWDNDEAAP